MFSSRHFALGFFKIIETTVDSPEYEKRKLIQKLSTIVLDDHRLNLIRNGGKINAEIVGSFYYDLDAVKLISEGEEIELQLEPDNPYDRFAVKATWKGRDIGYVQRSKARILSQELQSGKPEWITVKAIRYGDNRDIPQIEIEVQMGE